MNNNRSVTVFALALLAVVLITTPARGETTNCTAITSIPATITTQGIYCLTGNLSGNLATGNAITINTNNVTIDLNGYKLGNRISDVTSSSNTYGIYILNSTNFTVSENRIAGVPGSGILYNASTGIYMNNTVSGSVAAYNAYHSGLL